MFEGLVKQLILGYLGRYVKDIQKEQLKITLWNEEVLLENVEIALEAFDYLQLPFALKRGQIGKLSIKIPWKKLGWDPIVILLEDVFVCSSQRDDAEWSSDAVERREFAGKKAKLAAAELGKLSERVCDNRPGQSFISYITAKILDSIQVSIRRFHVLHHDKQGDSVHAMFGLKLSSLTIMKQNSIGLSSSRVRGAQVNKVVEIKGFEFYCGVAQLPIDVSAMDNARCEGKKFDSLVETCDISMSLLVNKSGEVDDDNPQYFINAELTALEMSLDEIQLQQILTLSDYLCISPLREKYGRYRPWHSPLSKKLKGWQVLWWQYAQQSVLSDVRKKLKKTSWRYLGQRLSYRRKYVNLYKTKLHFLRQEQSVDVNILEELEQMEKVLDIDYILSYRSSAERELEEFLADCSTFNINVNSGSDAGEKSRNDERLTGKSKGWLNWLSLGVLGAGGTDDSGQFSGVVSDEIIKDIFEATKFHQEDLSYVDDVANNTTYLCAVKFSIHQISLMLHSRNHGQEIAKFILNGATMECKLWEECATFLTIVNSVEVIYPCNRKAIFLLKRACNEKTLPEFEDPSCSVQVDFSPKDNVKLSVKGMLQPLEVICDVEFFTNLMEFFMVLKAFESHHERVLASLNGIKDVNSRLLSKAEHILSNRKNITWDFSITSVLISIPWVNGISEQNNLVFEVGALLMTNCDTGCVLPDEERHDALKNLTNSLLNTGVSLGFQPQDLYDHFEVKINDFEIKVEISSHSETVSILEKFSGSFLLDRCVIPDQSILKQLEVQISLPSICAHFSLPIYEAVIGLMIYLAKFQPKPESVYNGNRDSLNICNGRRNAIFGFSLNVRLEAFSLLVNSSNDEDNFLAITVNLQEVISCFHLAESEECLFFVKGLSISASPLRGESDVLVLCSSGTPPSSCQYGIDTGQRELIDKLVDQDISSEACFIMHYVSPKTGLTCHECTICLSDSDLHCYPDVIGSLIVFFDKLSAHRAPNDIHNSCGSLDAENLKEELGFRFQMFGFSNFLETESSQHACIPFDRFPFVTLHNSGSLACLESSLLYSGTYWRKEFIMRDGRIRSPQIRAYDVQNAYSLSYLESISTSDTDACLLSGRSDYGNLSVTNLNFCGIRVHFHDSSCTIGTINIPSLCGSLSIHEDFTDIMCSTEGLTLDSTLWKKNYFDFLWGPSLPNLSPILNVRVQRKRCRSSSYTCEVGLSVQNVNCILPPEYLALIIGYFSQSNWSGYLNGKSISKEDGNSGAENESSVIYKFEILDSFLIVPVESNENQFLKAGILQLYCSFILNSSLDDLLKGIHFECLIPTQNFAKRNNCLNIFGRDLVLSFLTFKEDGHTCLRLGHEAVCESITLLDPLSADIWVRIPCQSESSSPSTPITTCIMIRIVECQVSDEDGCSFFGFSALLDVINQFVLVSDRSNSYRSDALHFLKSSTCLEKKCASSPASPIVAYTEVRCAVDSFFIRLSSTRKGTSRPTAKVELKFLCSASLTNDCLSRLVVSFSSLSLFSLLNYVLLARCTPTCLISSVLEISLSSGNQVENAVHVSFPSLDVWVHLSCWTEIIDLFTYAGQRSNIAPLVKEHAENTEDSGLVVLLENIGITLHFPVWVSNETCRDLGTAECYSEASHSAASDTAGRGEFKSIAVTLHSRSTELLLDERKVNLKSNMEKLTGTISLSEDKNVQSWPLFQIFHVFLEAEINKDIEAVEVKFELHCDNFDVWLSHHFFYFWHGVPFITSEAESSQFPFRSINFNIQLRKVSFLLTDGQMLIIWHHITLLKSHIQCGLGFREVELVSAAPVSCDTLLLETKKGWLLWEYNESLNKTFSENQWSSGGPLFEVLLRDVLLHVNITECTWDGSVSSHIQVNYNNIHKVFWEPFVEPWQFEVNVTRKKEMSLSSSIMTDVNVKSTAQLNLNLTESVVECVSRTIDMIKDSLDMIEPNDIPESQKLLSSPYTGYAHTGKHAPYVVQNLTSLPLLYHVNRGPINELDAPEMNSWKSVQPGSSVPIYIVDTPEEHLFRARLAGSSDNLIDRKAGGVAHHFITIQLDGTASPSGPISMDLVGICCFEVDFSNAQSRSSENVRRNTNSGFVVPVVFDVSVQRHNKLIRIYSTVILSNATSMPLELRFDIPFGVSPKILDPIYPGQELPLPLHLAEAGRMRWRPIGNSYLWSEVYNLSNLLSQETRMGFLKSFVCYPAHPSSDQFRCCISVRSFSLPESGWAKKTPLQTGATSKSQVEKSVKVFHKLDEPHKRFVHQLILSTPLIVDNYLPKPVTVTIECGGVTRTEFLSEVVTSFHHVDPSHDLGLEIQMHGFKPSALKFPRAEAFCAMAKFSGTKFSLSEILTFDPVLLDGSRTYVTLEKTLDAFSGAREVFIFVPFLLYNCTAFPLVISEFTNEMEGLSCIIPSSYDVAGQELFNENKGGLYLVSSSNSPLAVDPYKKKSTSSNHIVSTRGSINPCKEIYFCNYIASSNSTTNHFELSSKGNLSSQNACSDSCQHKTLSLSGELTSSNFDCIGDELEKVVACMYSPIPTSAASEVKVSVRLHLPEAEKHVLNSVWSSPFLLVPPSGSTTVLVPLTATNTAFLMSVTSTTVAGPLTGRTIAISFQPRYVISNACSKDLCYMQKGTDFIFRLNRGEHSYLHWMDITRELLVSIRYNEPGWQWSGSFSPDHLGDTQVKMRNHVSSTLNIIRVEIQNADVLAGNEKNGGSLHGNSGTNLILLSDDDTGYMPYRVDNFTKERLRIFQQRCETFETTVHSYSSCPYAWDEPCYPHRLTVEVPGERVLGSFSLDEVKDYMSLYLPSSSEKPERTLLVSVYAEGATKVLRIIDSRYHVLNDVENASGLIRREKRKHDQKQDKVFDYREKLSVVLPYISISLIDFQPQELLFACAKNIKLDLLQSLDQQKLSFQVTSLQVDNQLRSSPYPVMLSFDHEYKSNPADHTDDCRKTTSERVLQRTPDISYEPVFCLAISKWRKKDISLVSFEYISLRVADFHLELEQELIFSLFDFIKNVSSRFESRVLPLSDPLVRSLIYDSGMLESSSDVQAFDSMKKRGDQLQFLNVPVFNRDQEHNISLPAFVPIGAPWQKIYLLARRQRKVYVEVFDVGPINLTLSFSSAPWVLRNGILTSGESLIHRGLMALADVEGAKIHLKQLTITHHIASWDSIEEIVIRHYTRQLLHEMYKVFGSAGVIGNPMGFARSLGHGISDFLSVPARSIFQSPTGLITGMAQGTTSLLSNTVYAISDAATQFSKAAHKGIVAFTFDDQVVSRVEQQQIGIMSHTKGVINEVFEGLTGLLQSPIKGAEKHGLPGVLSGIALGITGLVAKPAASILQVTGKTAQSIRNRSRLYQKRLQCFRLRLPRLLSREHPLQPYSWEEAVATSVLIEADGGMRLKDEVLVACKTLKEAGKFVIITERLVLIVSCSSLVDLGNAEFQGIPADIKWVVESEIRLDSVIHADADEGVVHIVGSSTDTILRKSQQTRRGEARTVHWNNPTLPLIQTSLELKHRQDAENLFQILLFAIEQGKEQGWGCKYILHRSSIK